ncbi:hypothetical protein D3C77_619320 [compost metagenome]
MANPLTVFRNNIGSTRTSVRTSPGEQSAACHRRTSPLSRPLSWRSAGVDKHVGACSAVRSNLACPWLSSLHGTSKIDGTFSRIFLPCQRSASKRHCCGVSLTIANRPGENISRNLFCHALHTILSIFNSNGLIPVHIDLMMRLSSV